VSQGTGIKHDFGPLAEQSLVSALECLFTHSLAPFPGFYMGYCVLTRYWQDPVRVIFL